MGKTILSARHTHPPKKYFVRKFLPTVSIWDKDSVRFSFLDSFSVPQAVEKKTGGNMRKEMHFSRFARCAVFVYNRNL